MSKGSGGTRTARPANNVNATSGQSGATKLAGALASIESSIRGNSFESVGIFDSQGNLLGTNTGTANRVLYPKGVNFKDSIITHNHPSEIGYGGSFSSTDLANSAILDISEHRAVDGRYTFIVKRGANGWQRPVKYQYASDALYTRAVHEKWSKELSAAKTAVDAYMTRHGYNVEKGERNFRYELITHIAAKNTARWMGGEYKAIKNK